MEQQLGRGAVPVIGGDADIGRIGGYVQYGYYTGMLPAQGLPQGAMFTQPQTVLPPGMQPMAVTAAQQLAGSDGGHQQYLLMPQAPLEGAVPLPGALLNSGGLVAAMTVPSMLEAQGSAAYSYATPVPTMAAQQLPQPALVHPPLPSTSVQPGVVVLGPDGVPLQQLSSGGGMWPQQMPPGLGQADAAGIMPTRMIMAPPMPPAPQPATVEELLKLLRRAPRGSAAVPIIADSLCFLDSRALAALLKELSKTGMRDAAFEIFDWLRSLSKTGAVQRSGLLDVYTYTTMIVSAPAGPCTHACRAGQDRSGQGSTREACRTCVSKWC